MPVIDPDGLFDGERICACSDRAQDWYVRLFCFANNFGRFLFDPDAIIARCFRSYNVKPTRDEILSVIGEYIDNFLAYPYPENDQIWIQLATDPKYLLRHKSKHDKRSPAPPAEIVAAFKHGYARWKDTHQSKALKAFSEKYPVFSENLFTSAERVPKKEDIFRSNSANEMVDGVGVGVGDGKDSLSSSGDDDVSESSSSKPEELNGKTSTSAADLDEYVHRWNTRCAPPLQPVRHLGKGRLTKLKVCIRENDLTLTRWGLVLDKLLGTPFCMGNGPNGWHASFDWLITSGNLDRVMEGAYDKPEKRKLVVREMPGFRELLRQP